MISIMLRPERRMIWRVRTSIHLESPKKKNELSNIEILQIWIVYLTLVSRSKPYHPQIETPIQSIPTYLRLGDLTRWIIFKNLTALYDNQYSFLLCRGDGEKHVQVRIPLSITLGSPTIWHQKLTESHLYIGSIIGANDLSCHYIRTGFMVRIYEVWYTNKRFLYLFKTFSVWFMFIISREWIWNSRFFPYFSAFCSCFWCLFGRVSSHIISSRFYEWGRAQINLD